MDTRSCFSRPVAAIDEIRDIPATSTEVLFAEELNMLVLDVTIEAVTCSGNV